MLQLQRSWMHCYPLPGREGLNLENSQVNSPTNFTMNIRNTGVVVKWLDAYGVNYYSNQYTKTNWTGPVLNPNQVAAINMIIDGSTFTFQSRTPIPSLLQPQGIT